MRISFDGLWRHQDFRRLWLGTSISQFGTMVGTTAMLFTAVIWLHAAAWEIAILTACNLVPGFLFAPIGGAWVDRLRRKPVLIWCDLGRFAAIATVPLAAAFDALTIWQLCVVALATTTMTQALFEPAYEAFLPQLIERRNLIEGNGKLAASASVSEVAGFGISGWLVVLLRAPGALVVDSLSYLGSAFFIARIRTEEPPPQPAEHREPLIQEIRAGARYVMSSSVLRSLAAADFFLGMGSRMLSVVFLIYLQRDIGFSPGVLGMIFGVGGISSFLSSMFAGRIVTASHFGMVMVVALVLVPIGGLAMPLTTSVSVLGVALLVANQLITDPGWTLWEVTRVSVRQGITPDHLLGRMNASMRFVEFLGASLGAGIAGVLGGTIGPRATLFIAISVLTLPALSLLLSPLARMARPPLRIDETSALPTAGPAVAMGE